MHERPQGLSAFWTMEAEVWWFLEQVLLLGTVVGSSVPFGDSSVCFRVHQGKKKLPEPVSQNIQGIFSIYYSFWKSNVPVLTICYRKKKLCQDWLQKFVWRTQRKVAFSQILGFNIIKLFHALGSKISIWKLCKITERHEDFRKG